jgi:hypothetical protein
LKFSNQNQKNNKPLSIYDIPFLVFRPKEDGDEDGTDELCHAAASLDFCMIFQTLSIYDIPFLVFRPKEDGDEDSTDELCHASASLDFCKLESLR